MKPKYAEDIVVAIKDNGLFEWYILNKEIVYLDYIKWIKSFNVLGFNLPISATDRFNILVVNNDTKEEFLNNIISNKISTELLRKMLLLEENQFERLAYNPAVLIDFDQNILISNYNEPESFEDFVPDNWNGYYQCFENIIPLNQRYWLSETGISLIGDKI